MRLSGLFLLAVFFTVSVLISAGMYSVSLFAVLCRLLGLPGTGKKWIVVLGSEVMAMVAGLASFGCGVVSAVLLFMAAMLVEWSPGTI